MNENRAQEQDRSVLSRRRFFNSVAGGVAGTAILGGPATAGSPPAPNEREGEEMMEAVLNIDGRIHTLMVEPRWTLLYVLRDCLGLTATKSSCERGECGACTVLIDGETRCACMTLALEAAGTQITTLTGLMHGEQLGPVQQAFLEEDGFQCGYCTPGQIVSVEGLLRKTPDPTLEQIREGISGNLCRCGAYGHIFKAAIRAAVLKKGGR